MDEVPLKLTDDVHATTPYSFVAEVCRVLDDFLSGKTRGSECVRSFDTLMADELPDGLPAAQLNSLHDLQSDLALYVEDAELRKEDPSYYGPEELRRKVTAFRQRELT